MKWPWQSTPTPVKSVRREPVVGGLPTLDGAYKATRGHFFSGEVNRFFDGWDTSSNSIDYYLRDELPALRARCRKLSRQNNFGARFVELMKNNIVGHAGVTLHSLVMKGRELDELANNAIEAAWFDWGDNYADMENMRSMVDFQDASVVSAATDGEVIFEIHRGPTVNKYGFALKLIDAELLDITKNEQTRAGEIRMGVEYDARGRRIRYHFRDRGFDGSYLSGKTYTVDAVNIIHAFIPLASNQSRGVPWMAPGLEKAKHLEKFTEAALVRVRATASRVAALRTTAGNEYTGDESGPDGVEYDLSNAGEVWDIGNREITQLDGNYPGEMYEPFIRRNLQDLASAWSVSYPALSGDLSDTSFSSGRTGVMEEREAHKKRQSWLVRQIINVVYPEWLTNAYMMGVITMGKTRATPLNRPIDDYLVFRFQGRRWDWVDPDKDSKANERDINMRLRSRSAIIRERGDDPQVVFAEIEQEEKRFGTLTKPDNGAESDQQEGDDDPKPEKN